MTDPYLLIEDAMSSEAREAFLREFYRLNPHMRGAQVADALGIMDDSDVGIDMTETIYEVLAKRIPEQHRRLIAPAVLSVHFSHTGYRSPDHDIYLTDLLMRAEKLVKTVIEKQP